MSGGQKQKVGLARALYQDSEILILDESTSALDNITQKLIINNLKSMKTSITIIMITHRLKLVEKCDNIFLIDKGKIEQQGKFEELIKKSDYFKKSLSE